MIDREGGLGKLAGIPRNPALTKLWSTFGPGLKKGITTLILLGLIYWGVTSLVAYITAPRLEMTMSPVLGRIAVVAEPARVEPISRRVTYTGSVSAFQEVTVSPRVEGWVSDFSLYEGDHVEQGAVIARLDRAELGAAAAQARFAIGQAEAGLARAKTEIAQTAEARAQAEAGLAEGKAGLTQVQAELEYVKAEYDRDRILVAKGAIATSAFDQRQAQFTVSQERILQARAKIRQMEAAINRAIARQDEAVKMVAQAEAMLAQAREEYTRRRVILGYTDIVAPIGGRVAKRHVYAGVLLRPGMPLVDLQDLSRVRVQVKVGEKDLPYIRKGSEAIVRFLSLASPSDRFTAPVSTVFPQLDPVTRTATVEVVLKNPGERIKADMYAIVELVIEKKERAVTVPRLAVLEAPGRQPIVYATDAVSAMSRPVKLGIAEGDRVEILEGVKEGEMVVFKGQRNLSEGAQVNVVPEL